MNISKTKILIFSRGKVKSQPLFTFSGVPVEVVQSYCYLGLNLNYNGRFNLTQKHLYDKASRAMFGLVAKCRKLQLPIDISIKLFDSVIKPILIYGCEIWGYQYCGLADKLQVKFIKLIMGLKSYTPTVMVRGETGSLPTVINIKCRMLNFWFRLVTKTKDGCIDKTLYSHMLEMQQNHNNAHQWINFIKNCLDKLGLSYIFVSHAKNINPAWFKQEIKKRLNDAFVQDWSRDLCDNKACTNYRLFKKDFAMERYLIDIPWCFSYQLLKFRVRNIKPLCEYIFSGGVDDSPICSLCDQSGCDEFHLLLTCTALGGQRHLLGLRIVPNVLFFCRLMNLHDVAKLARFVRTICLTLKESQKKPH